ncbi:VCBS repeat-containing protein [Streptomyces sp. NPDC089919]|uniref:FG-GAP repeat domain-containing protein n=1 Tax=Streptomyces sp. NPDC089919 TaxID=3155188 RepID=UPI003419FCB8
MRRMTAVGGAVALLLAGAGAAVADSDPTFAFDGVRNYSVMPGEGWAELQPSSVSGSGSGGDGTFVYAVSRKPLTDAAWTAGGAPAGLKAEANGCTAKAGVAGVYLCDYKDWNLFGPKLVPAASAAHGTTAYYGVVYVPRGESVATGIKQAQTAAARPEDGRHAARTVTVKSAAHVAQNKLALTTPGVSAGSSVQHTVTLHAVDAGELQVFFEPAPGYRAWDQGELKGGVTAVSSTGAPAPACDHSTGEPYGATARCTVTAPGDYTLTYTWASEAAAPAWKLTATAKYQVYQWDTGNPQATSAFAVRSDVPVVQRYKLFARTATGDVVGYDGRAKGEFFDNLLGGTFDWNRYTALTTLAPVTVQGTGQGAVGRDRAGVLWYHRSTTSGAVFRSRLKVGGGWNVYDTLVGTSDLTGDGKADLVARDTSGVLWLYRATGTSSAPFAPRTKVGTGWQQYGALARGNDLTGDGKADLLARDKTGVLWLHPGTGKAAAPFAPRVKVGGGWNAFNALVGFGDLNGDGKADLLARDAAGVLSLYKGTGQAAAPFAPRVKAATGFKQYNLLF